MTQGLSTDAMKSFIHTYPGMGLWPTVGRDVLLKGDFEFAATSDGVEVHDTYQLRIEVPQYPALLPRVFEVGGRIKPVADQHAFASGQLCLGSELRLRTIIGATLDLLHFADKCIVPYLYATTRRGVEGRYIFGELAHDSPGLLADYMNLFGVHDEASVIAAFRILTTKPSSADRHPCPCSCGKRLVQCSFKSRISEIRGLAPRGVFRQIFASTFPVARNSK